MIDLSPATMVPPEPPAIYDDRPAPADDDVPAWLSPRVPCGAGECRVDMDVDVFDTWPWAVLVLKWMGEF